MNLEAGIYEEACFESLQAAEKALKALLEALGAERRGHALVYLYRVARSLGAEAPSDVVECLHMLDKHYTPARYPNAYPEGAPLDYYTRRDAEECIRCAELVLSWVEEALREVQGAGATPPGALRVEGEGRPPRG